MRFIFAREHEDQTLEQWKKVIRLMGIFGEEQAGEMPTTQHPVGSAL